MQARLVKGERTSESHVVGEKPSRRGFRTDRQFVLQHAAVGESAGHAGGGRTSASRKQGEVEHAAYAGADWLKTLRPEPPPANPAHRPSRRARQGRPKRSPTPFRLSIRGPIGG